MSKKPYERFILPRTKVAAIREERALQKAVEQQRRAVKCIVCDLGSVAPLLRVDRVPACSASHTRRAEKAEYVHGLCIERLRKKYPPRSHHKHHEVKTVPLGHVA